MGRHLIKGRGFSELQLRVGVSVDKRHLVCLDKTPCLRVRALLDNSSQSHYLQHPLVSYSLENQRTILSIQMDSLTIEHIKF